MSGYVIIKQIHVLTVIVSFIGFFMRGMVVMSRSSQVNARWFRVVPHINDTILIVTAVVLTIYIGQYPFADAWLTAKLVALVFHVVVGAYAIKHAKTFTAQLLSWLFSIVVFVYIVGVAYTRDVYSYLSYLL